MTDSNITRVEVKPGIDGQFYFHGKADNGEIILSSEGYTRLYDALEAAQKAWPEIQPKIVEGP